MKTLRIQDSDATLFQSVTNGTGGDLTAGQGLALGGGVVILVNDVADGASGPAMNGGVHSVAKVSAQAWAQGAAIYWDATAKLFTTVAGGNTKAGFAYEAAANPSATGLVRILPIPGA